MVAITITSITNTIVFFVPITERITSIFGSDKAGPASKSASAGPLPMPLPSSPCKMGTSVRVAKYMKAPTTDANKLAPIELPPTDPAIGRDQTFMPGATEQQSGHKHPAE